MEFRVNLICMIVGQGEMHELYISTFMVRLTCICMIVGQGEMHELKRRLLETESQMTRILGAMESVQQHTQQVIDEASREEGDGEEEDQGEWIEEDEEGTMEDGEEMDHIEVEVKLLII